jgi:uncharacterized delta-60 repeat protein
MARIKKYPINFDIHPKDIVIGTDRIDFDKTKNFRMETLKEFFTTDVDFGQNNLVREYFIGFAQDKTELNNILDNINLTVSDDENVIVTYFTPSPSNANLWVQAMLWWKKGKGVYNPIGSTDFTGKFLQLPVVFPTEENVNIITSAPNAIVHDYGTITVPAWQAINNASPAVDYSDVTKIYYVKARFNDIDFLFVFDGANGLYGVGELQAIDDDLILLFSSQVQGTQFFNPLDYDLSEFTNVSSDPFIRESDITIPSWQETINTDRNADRATLFHSAYGEGVFGGYSGASPTVVLEDPNSGRIYYYGFFTTFNGETVNHIVAVNPDGTLDDTFVTGTGFNSTPFVGTKIAIQSDGKIIFTGQFTSYNGTPANRIIRLNTDGSIDASFVYGTGFNNFTLNAVLDNNDKIYVTGIFSSYNGNTGRNRIIRLNQDGSIDSGFDAGTGFNNTVTDLVVDVNNDIYVVGYFSSWKGVTGNNRIIKILENGDKDTSFNTGTGFNSGTNQVIKVYLTSDNKVFVIGWFTLYNGTTIDKMVKLNLDGSIDTSFQSQGTGFNGTNLNYFFEYQGNYILSGDFTSYNGVPSNGTIILDTSGEIVRTFPFNTSIREVTSGGDVIGVTWDGAINSVGVLEDNVLVSTKRFNYDETNGKATYEIGGLFSTVEEEILPKRLIRELIQLEAPLPNLSGLVPYTGATQNVDLGTYSIKADNFSSTNSSETSDAFLGLINDKTELRLVNSDDSHSFILNSTELSNNVNDGSSESKFIQNASSFLFDIDTEDFKKRLELEEGATIIFASDSTGNINSDITQTQARLRLKVDEPNLNSSVNITSNAIDIEVSKVNQVNTLLFDFNKLQTQKYVEAEGFRGNYVYYDTDYVADGNEPQGAVYWNTDRQTLQLKMNGTNYDYGMGLFFYVKNQSGIQINKGDVVGFAGTLGMSGIILGAKYVNDGLQPSDRLMGVAKENIPNGAEGKVVFFGEVRGIDTNAFTAGTILYASNFVPGALSNVIPFPKTNKGEIAAVVSQSSTTGTIFVRALINKNIEELNNVNIFSPTQGQALVYDANGFWKNKSLQREVKVVAGTTYTLLEEDGNKILHFTNNSDVTITIPTGLTSTNRYEGKQLGDGQLIFGTDIGVDLRVGTSEVAKTAEKYSVFGLDVIGTEEYMLFGKLELS